VKTHTRATGTGFVGVRVWVGLRIPQGYPCHALLPTCTISDRGPQFTVAFMTDVYRLLGIKAAKTTAYHPQVDGQTERVNQELEQYLWLFVGERQDDWANLLPMAEFQYNNHIHLLTQQTPFFLDSGRHPQMGFELQQPSQLESVNENTSTTTMICVSSATANLMQQMMLSRLPVSDISLPHQKQHSYPGSEEHCVV